MNIIEKIKGLSKEKKLIIIGVIAVIVIGIIIATAVGGNNVSKGDSKTLEEKISNSIENYVRAKLVLTYSANRADATVTSITIRGEEVQVYGTTKVVDKYNDTFKGKFNGTVDFEQKENGSIKLKNHDLDITTPTKSNF